MFVYCLCACDAAVSDIFTVPLPHCVCAHNNELDLTDACILCHVVPISYPLSLPPGHGFELSGRAIIFFEKSEKTIIPFKQVLYILDPFLQIRKLKFNLII